MLLHSYVQSLFKIICNQLNVFFQINRLNENLKRNLFGEKEFKNKVDN
jgi:hypothetical protein